MSQVTEQSVRFQTALASIKLIQASAVLDLTEDDFDFLTSNKVWIATDRSRARRCVEACVYGTLDFVGYPRFPAPVEFIAAVIAYYVHPVNIRNKTRDGLIRVMNIRALNGRFNTSITHAYSIVIDSKHITLNATGGGFLTASKQFRHGATSKSRSNTASNSTKHKSPHLSGWRQIISLIT